MTDDIGIPAAIENYYNYQTHAASANAFSDNLGHSQDQRNTFAHAYVSAMIIIEYSFVEALLLGNGREARTTFEYYFLGGEDHRRDTYIDLWAKCHRSSNRYVRESK